MTNRHFSSDDLEKDSYFQIPKTFFYDERYRNLPAKAKIAWAILLDLLKDSLYKGWVCEETGTIYFLNVERYLNYFFPDESEEIIQQLIDYHLLQKERTSISGVTRYYLCKYKHETTEPIIKWKETYLQNVRASSAAEEEAKLKEAIEVINQYFSISEQNFLTKENKLILYEHLDKIEWLKKRGRFSLPLLFTLKTKYALNARDFNDLLQKAFSLYTYDDLNALAFHEFFEKLIENQRFVYQEETLIWEIDQKLVSLPNELKKFVYNEMRKYLNKFPERYEQILNHLRMINTIYEDYPNLPNDVFQKAFRRLFADYNIRHIGSFFKKGIEQLLNEKRNEQNEIEVIEEQKHWLEQLFGDVANDKDTPKKRDDYEERKAKLLQKIKSFHERDKG